VTELVNFYRIVAVFSLVLGPISVYGHGWTVKAARRFASCMVTLIVATVLMRWLILAPPSNQWMPVLGEAIPIPLALFLSCYAVGFDAARTSRLLLFTAIVFASRNQFGGLDKAILTVALAIDLELHRDAWKKGLIGSLVGIAALWMLTYFISDVIKSSDTDFVFAASIFCFVHAWCFLDIAPKPLPAKRIG